MSDWGYDSMCVSVTLQVWGVVVCVAVDVANCVLCDVCCVTIFVCATEVVTIYG